MSSTTQDARKGDEIEREYAGETYRFRVRRGGHENPSDNSLTYLSDPAVKPLPAGLLARLEANEASVMWYIDHTQGDGCTYPFDPDADTVAMDMDGAAEGGVAR
jgi:hypothetical protein